MKFAYIYIYIYVCKTGFDLLYEYNVNFVLCVNQVS